MDHTFWIERWQRHEIGFHHERVQPALVQHWPRVDLAPGGRVFVPLAGKSHDMTWLAEKGYAVAGVELSPLAVEEFFAARGESPEIESRDGFTISRKNGVEIWCGDYFALTREVIGAFDAVYDRAALVAMLPEMQANYVKHLASLLPKGARGLLIGLDYNSAEMKGPPFSVPQARVSELFDGLFDVTLLDARDGLTKSENLAKRGITRLEEASYLLRRT